jgi:hypothetical protein
MNPTTALMLSRALEAEHRRSAERRWTRRIAQPERPASRERLIQVPRWFRFLRPAGSGA